MFSPLPPPLNHPTNNLRSQKEVVTKENLENYISSKFITLLKRHLLNNELGKSESSKKYSSNVLYMHMTKDLNSEYIQNYLSVM